MAKQLQKQQWCTESAATDLSFDRFALAVDHSVWSYDAVRRRISFNHLELDGPHATPHQKYVALVKWPIRLEKIWFQVDIKQVAANMEQTCKHDTVQHKTCETLKSQ